MTVLSRDNVTPLFTYTRKRGLVDGRGDLVGKTYYLGTSGSRVVFWTDDDSFLLGRLATGSVTSIKNADFRTVRATLDKYLQGNGEIIDSRACGVKGPDEGAQGDGHRVGLRRSSGLVRDEEKGPRVSTRRSGTRWSSHPDPQKTVL